MSKAEEYIIEHTSKLKESSGHEYFMWLTPDQAREAAGIAREEMIEKACEYIDGLIELLNDRGHQLKKERIIDGLKQAMRDE